MNLRNILIAFCTLIPAATAQEAFPIRCAEGMCILPQVALERIAERMDELMQENRRLKATSGCL
jgi:hypothetical protein